MPGRRRVVQIVKQLEGRSKLEESIFFIFLYVNIKKNNNKLFYLFSNKKYFLPDM